MAGHVAEATCQNDAQRGSGVGRAEACPSPWRRLEQPRAPPLRRGAFPRVDAGAKTGRTPPFLGVRITHLTPSDDPANTLHLESRSDLRRPSSKLVIIR